MSEGGGETVEVSGLGGTWPFCILCVSFDNPRRQGLLMWYTVQFIEVIARVMVSQGCRWWLKGSGVSPKYRMVRPRGSEAASRQTPRSPHCREAEILLSLLAPDISAFKPKLPPRDIKILEPWVQKAIVESHYTDAQIRTLVNKRWTLPRLVRRRLEP